MGTTLRTPLDLWQHGISWINSSLNQITCLLDACLKLKRVPSNASAPTPQGVPQRPGKRVKNGVKCASSHGMVKIASNIMMLRFICSILYRTRDGRGNEPQPAKSESEIRKSALTSLSHPGNPLTDRERIKVVEYVWSCATGHQQGDVRRNLGSYKASRNAKMGAQQEPARTTLFRGCVIYCDSE